MKYNIIEIKNGVRRQVGWDLSAQESITIKELFYKYHSNEGETYFIIEATKPKTLLDRYKSFMHDLKFYIKLFKNP